LHRWLAYKSQQRTEAYYRKIFHKSGYLLALQGDAAATFADASEHISPKIYGEVIPTVGDGVRAQVEGYDGIIIIGPFNCLPFRIAEAILKPLSIRSGMPILTYESDGYAVSPSFISQVEVHAQQVLEHRARNPMHNAA
jgi:predicted nucleotide-binding protein (sugar kinase/HSP70/actin superfamily)